MSVRDAHDVERLIDSVNDTIRPVRGEVVPTTEDRIERSLQSPIDSIERQLDAARRLPHRNED